MAKGNKVIGLDSSFHLFYDRKAARVRAAIVASPQLDLWPVAQYTDGDLATCLWKTAEHNIPEVYVVSAYCDITDPQVCSCKLLNLLRMADSRQVPVLLLMDANAHSTLWGCADTNRRGETLEEVIFLQNLAVLNDGSTPTFVNHLTREGTRPDVSLCSPQLEACITSWRVDETTPGSDHNLILLDIRLAIPPESWRRNYRKGNWKLFQTCMETNTPPTPPEWSIEHLEAESQSMVTQMEAALKRSHPPKKCSPKVKEFRWWSGELASSHRLLRTAQSAQRKTPSPAHHACMVERRRAFVLYCIVFQ